MSPRTAVVIGLAALLAAAAAAVLVLLRADYRKVRETDELVERVRADKTLLDDNIGDDVVAMLAAWRDEVEQS